DRNRPAEVYHVAAQERIMVFGLHSGARRCGPSRERIPAWDRHFPEILPKRPGIGSAQTHELGIVPGFAMIGADLDARNRFFSRPSDAEDAIGANSEDSVGTGPKNLGLDRHRTHRHGLDAFAAALLDHIFLALIVPMKRPIDDLDARQPFHRGHSIPAW